MKKKIMAAVLAAMLLGGAVTATTATDIVLDLKIHLIGDINGDGKVNSTDKKILYNHINDKVEITDDYQLEVADVNGDAKINSVDKKLIYNHINDISSLWE